MHFDLDMFFSLSFGPRPHKIDMVLLLQPKFLAPKNKDRSDHLFFQGDDGYCLMDSDSGASFLSISSFFLSFFDFFHLL